MSLDTKSAPTLQILGDVRGLAVEHPEAEHEDRRHERYRLQQGRPAANA